MGFFDWFLKGLGMESTEPKKGKKKKTKNIDKDKYESFNLHEQIKGAGLEQLGDMLNINTTSNFVVHKPKSHKDVQLVIDYLRQNQAAYLDLSCINADEASRILDFLSGAIYALNGNILKVEADRFILTPANSKIMVPAESKGA